MSDESKKTKKAAPADDDVPLEANDDILADDIAEAEAETKADDEEVAAAKQKGNDAKEDTNAREISKKKEKAVRRKDHDPIVWASFIVFMLCSIVVLGNTVYDETMADKTGSIVSYGDAITISYTGSYYGYYNEDTAMIFDTTVSSIGNGTSYVKSWEYSKTSYSDLDITINSSASYLEMFKYSVIGHHVGETVQVKIPAVSAYGELTSDQIKTLSCDAGSVDLTRTFDASAFKTFFGSTAVNGSTIASPYGWDAKVTVNSDSTVTVVYLPVVGTEYTMNDYVKVTVTAISDGKIAFTYSVSGYKTYDGSMEMVKIYVGNNAVYLYKLDGSTMTYKTTAEKIGMDLYFTIRIVGFQSSSS